PSFTYNNLPTFMNSNSLRHTSQASANQQPTTNIGNLPFVTQESILNRSDFIPLGDAHDFHNIVTFDSSGPGLTTLQDPGLDPETEFLNFLKFIAIMSVQLGKKGILWLVFVLNVIFSQLSKLIDQIPNPKIFEEPEEEMLESTPLSQDNKGNRQEGLTALFNKIVPASLSTPLTGTDVTAISFSHLDDSPMPLKRSNGSNQSVKSRISQLASKLQKEEDTATLISQVKDYGTFFFDNHSSKSGGPDIEAMFLRSNFDADEKMKTQQNNADFKTYNVERIDKLTDSVSIFPKLQQNGSSIIKQEPQYSRSTARFKDLEWLKDDAEDYVDNLESTKLFQEYQKIMLERIKMQNLLKLNKIKDEGKLKPLSQDQVDLVEEYWNSPNMQKLIIDAFNIDIKIRDLKTLADHRWLNDNVIDFYMCLVKDRSVNDSKLPKVHVFSTHFYSTLRSKGYDGVKKWAKRAKADVTKLDYVFVPINLNQSHWVLAVINNKDKCFQYYDSLYGSGEDVLYRLQDYAIKETTKNYDSTTAAIYNTYDHFASMNSPKQENGYDCGVFTCTAVDYISRNKSLLFSQADMGMLRRRMAYEICTKKMVEH
ncbi:hypothetical protein CANARDRAFT_184298, partial [[Candida] arabinofermentans NRRL YB-2248]